MSWSTIDLCFMKSDILNNEKAIILVSSLRSTSLPDRDHGHHIVSSLVFSSTIPIADDSARIAVRGVTELPSSPRGWCILSSVPMT